MHTTNEQNFPLTFESFEQLLGKYSPEYIKKFSNELCEKLQTIKNTQELKIEDANRWMSVYKKNSITYLLNIKKI